MMNKTITKIFSLIILGFFLINSINSYSQEEKKPLKWSYGIKDYGHGINNLGATDKYMLIQINNKKPDIAILSLTNFSIYKRIKAFSPKTNNQSLTYEKSIVFNNELIVLANSTDKQYLLYYSIPKFNKIKTVEIGTIKSRIDISNEDYLNQFSIKKHSKKIELIKSKDKKSLMFLYNNCGLDSSEIINYVVHIINPDLNDTTYSISFDQKYNHFNLLSSIITDNGVPCFLYKQNIEDIEIVYNLYDGNTNQHIPIELPIEMYNPILVENRNDIVILSMSKFENSFGLLQYTYSNDMHQFEDVVFTKMDDELRSENENDFERDENDNIKWPIYNYYIDGSVLIDEDTRIVYGENYDLSRTIVNNKTRIRHTAKEIFFLVTNIQGDKLFYRTFPKLQYFENSDDQLPSWGSYIFMKNNEELHFIFQEDKTPFELLTSKVYNQKILKPKGKADKTIDLTFSYSFDIRKKQWQDNIKSKTYPNSFISIDLGNGIYIIGSENKYDATKQIFKFTKYKYSEN